MNHIYFFLVGSVLASFLGLVIDRFPEQSIIAPSSHCDTCQTRLAPRDLVPIISQVVNGFRCRFCKTQFPVWYAGFELVLGLLFLAGSLSILTPSQVLLLTAGLTLAIYDIRHQEYPLMVWLVFHLILMGLAGWNPLMLIFLLIGLVAHFVPVGIGAGDFLFLASCATIFSLTELLILIQVASLTGILIFIIQGQKGRLAFVPCLIVGLVFLIFGKMLLLG